MRERRGTGWCTTSYFVSNEEDKNVASPASASHASASHASASASPASHPPLPLPSLTILSHYCLSLILLFLCLLLFLILVVWLHSFECLVLLPFADGLGVRVGIALGTGCCLP